MGSAERLKALPGYLAFNAGVMFFIGLASKLTNEAASASLGAGQLRLMGFAILLAVLAMAAGFASVARIESAKRSGKRFSIAWILPSVAVGLPLGRAIGGGAVSETVMTLPAIGATGALAALAGLAVRARREVAA